MVFYRRNFIPGGTYFFTVALTDRKRDWLVRHINLLRLAFRRAKRERPFTIDAIVVLPEHLHCVWTLPRGDADYRTAGVCAPIHQSAKGEYNVWQRRFWEHTVRDEADLLARVDYIHYNPVKQVSSHG
jgi:putative transposase